MSDYAVIDGEVEGLPVTVLSAREARLEAAWAPGAGMVGCSLRHRGEELLGQRDGLVGYAQSGSSMGIPLLHPWANRLERLGYAAAGREVALDPEAMPLRLDPNGLPIHGLAVASPHWDVSSAEADASRARLAARLDWAAHPELMAGFPFAHELEVEVALSGRTLSVETVVRPGGEAPVPVAFGWHPYLTLPGVARDDWEVTLPLRRRAQLDERGIPTGEDDAMSDPSGPLDGREFDDLFPELVHPPVFLLRGGGRCLELRFEQGYPVAQVYAPRGEEFICFEPMTAPTNALVTGEHLKLAEPGGAYVARFSLSVFDEA
jgi:aldose 1-epimerase